jgi:hypothetical protein
LRLGQREAVSPALVFVQVMGSSPSKMSFNKKMMGSESRRTLSSGYCGIFPSNNSIFRDRNSDVMVSKYHNSLDNMQKFPSKASGTWVQCVV